MNKNQLKQFLGVLAARRPSFGHLLTQANSSMVEYLSCGTSGSAGPMNGPASAESGRMRGRGPRPIEVSAKNSRLELAAPNSSDLSLDSSVPETTDGDRGRAPAFEDPYAAGPFDCADQGSVRTTEVAMGDGTSSDLDSSTRLKFFEDAFGASHSPLAASEAGSASLG